MHESCFSEQHVYYEMYWCNISSIITLDSNYYYYSNHILCINWAIFYFIRHRFSLLIAAIHIQWTNNWMYIQQMQHNWTTVYRVLLQQQSIMKNQAAKRWYINQTMYESNLSFLFIINPNNSISTIYTINRDRQQHEKSTWENIRSMSKFTNQD